jgi:hypothetical protein
MTGPHCATSFLLRRNHPLLGPPTNPCLQPCGRTLARQAVDLIAEDAAIVGAAMRSQARTTSGFHRAILP